MEFEDYPNSLLYELTAKNKETISGNPLRKKSTLKTIAKKNLSLISGLYIYTNTPPHGYGTQAPKVAETVLRAYGFSSKEKNKTINIMNRDIERMHWEKEDGAFPFDKIHGNFIPSEARLMVDAFLKKNQPYIDSCVDEVMKKVLETNSDILTKGAVHK